MKTDHSAGLNTKICFNYFVCEPVWPHCKSPDPLSDADRAANEALEKEPINELMPFSDLKPLTAKYIHRVWQKEWDEAIIVSNKLHDISPKLSDKLLTFCNIKKEDTVLNSLHIGHSYFTHSFLLKERRASCVCSV